MSVGELLSLFPADSTVQINIITDPGSLTFIPSPGYYQEKAHWKTMQDLAAIPITSLSIETEEADGQQFILLMINEEVQK